MSDTAPLLQDIARSAPSLSSIGPRARMPPPGSANGRLLSGAQPLRSALRNSTTSVTRAPGTVSWDPSVAGTRRERFVAWVKGLTMQHYFVGAVVTLFLGLAITLISMLANRFRKNKKKRESPGGKSASLVLSSASTIKSQDTASSKFTVAKPGTNWGLSFWVFLEDFEYTKGMKSVMHVSPTNKDGEAPTLAVWLDTDVPRMWIALRNAGPNMDEQAKVTRDNLMDVLLNASCTKAAVDSNDDYYDASNSSCVDYRGYFLTAVDYIPMREWTHLTIGIDGPIVSVYKNGSPLQTSRAAALIKAPEDGSVVRVGKTQPNSALFVGNVMSAVVFKNSTPHSEEANNGFLSPPFKDRFDNGEDSLNSKKKSCDC